MPIIPPKKLPSSPTVSHPPKASPQPSRPAAAPAPAPTPTRSWQGQSAFESPRRAPMSLGGQEPRRGTFTPASPGVGSIRGIRRPAQNPKDDGLLGSTFQRAAAALGQKEFDSYGGKPIDQARLEAYFQGISHDTTLPWCGIFTEFLLKEVGFLHNDVLTSSSKAIKFFTEPGSERQMFVLQGTVVGQGLPQWNTGQGVNSLPTPSYTFSDLPIRPGDVAIFNTGAGHVGLVQSYDPETGILSVIEGNVEANGHDYIMIQEYNLSNSTDRAKFDGFGRPSLYDFNLDEMP